MTICEYAGRRMDKWRYAYSLTQFLNEFRRTVGAFCYRNPARFGLA
jgi:hypothetical protein